jgi:hypothetical protein
MLAYPKPSKPPKPAIKVFRDGREACDLLSAEGRTEYRSRVRQMWERQNHFCCLYGYIPSCPGRLRWEDATFDHESTRGLGGGLRDDRILIQVKQRDGSVKTRWQNGACHPQCNCEKGSRRIAYNARRNGDLTWELIPKTIHGEPVYRCSGCGHETAFPAKKHVCGHREEA